jgi:hypothetical protein
MAVPAAVEFVLQACEAIGEAHALGIVHRDLKPANLFVTRRVDGSPCIKVLDFGISKLTLPGAGPDFGMTKTNTVMGSPLYMSPEQMSSTRNVDMRTDIWALGVILYEILTGRVPFEAETMPQLCGMILQDPPRPLRDLRPDLPDSLQAVVFRCLEKNREQRFANVADLAAALAPFGLPSAQRSAERIARVLGAAGIASARNLSVGATSSPAANTQSNWGGAQPPQKSRAPLFVGLALLLLLLAGIALFVTRKSASVEPAAEPRVSATLSAAALPSVTAAPTLTVQPELAPASGSLAPPAASAASAASAAAATPKPKLGASKPKPPAAAPGIDPLDGRR